MKEPKLKIIIVLMAASVMALIAIQYYWITTLLKTEEARFDKNVNEALQHFTYALDKDEAKKSFEKHLYDTGRDIYAQKVKGKKAGFAPTPVKQIIEIRTDRNDTSKISARYNFVYSGNVAVADTSKLTKGMPLIVKEENVMYSLNGSRLPSKTYLSTTTKEKPIHGTVTSIVTSGKAPRTAATINGHAIWTDSIKPATIQFKRAELVNNVITDMMVLQKHASIDEILNKERIDSSLAKVFVEKGIPINFVYEVKATPKDSVIWTTVSDAKPAQTKAYKQDLFPTNPFLGNKYAIAVEFPQMKSFIFGNVLWMFILSIVIILIIIGIFYQTIRMFLKQKKISQIKSDLINNITHEFKTPIATISLACQAIVEPQLVNNEASLGRYSKMIKEENERLSMMVENLLSAAAIEKGEYSINREELDLHDVITKTAEKFSIIFDKAHGSLQLHLEAERAEIFADSFHITNIVNNLLDNAFKYGGKNPKAEIFTSNVQNGIMLTIRDYGIGIPASEQKRIFETFYRVPTGNVHDVKGSGIGLSYVKKLIEEHKGTISVESTLDEGSTFTIFLPFE